MSSFVVYLSVAIVYGRTEPIQRSKLRASSGEALGVLGSVANAANPLVEVCLEPHPILRDLAPRDVEIVVTVVEPSAYEGWQPNGSCTTASTMKPGDERAIRIRPNDSRLNDLLGDDDDAARGVRRLLLNADESPDLRIPFVVGALNVHEHDVRIQRAERRPIVRP